METQASEDGSTNIDLNMSEVQNDPCDENHEMKDNEIQRDNNNYISSKGDVDDDKIKNQNPQIEQSSSGSRKKPTSALKRKKLPSSHLAQTSLKNSVSLSTSAIITNSPTVHHDPREERERRQKKKITRQRIEPERDILQQKYQELHQLLVLPLVQPMSKNVLKIGHLLRLQPFNEASDNELSPDHTHGRVSDVNGDYHDTSLQHKQVNALNRPLHQEMRWRSQSSTDVGYSQWVRQNKNKQQNNTANEKIIEKENQVKKHIFQPADTFLKNTNNPSIKQWLKKKEREIRKRKREERKKLKEERLKKQEQEMLKQEKFKDSDLKVREWMLLKRKEAMTKTKECKQLEKDEIKEASGDTARSLPLPEGSEATTTLSSHGDAQSITNLNIELKEQVAQPTPSSFVYARPVSGRVRLIKLQQLHKENAKNEELEKQMFKKHLEKEKTKKMRVSYDQWLLKKREEDYTKRQEAARLRALAKSDSELHNVGVENARKRVKSFNRSKKIIDGNESEPEKTLDNDNTSPLNGLHKIKVQGSKKNLNVRPSSARSSLSPRIAKTFHRPLSANPAVKHSDTGTAHDGEGKQPFRIPFPPETGAPKYVLDKQRKLFSPRLTQTTVCDTQKSDVGNQDERNVINEKSAGNFDVNQTKEDLNHKSTAVIDLQVTKQVEVNEIKHNPVVTNVKQGSNEIKAKKETANVSELKNKSRPTILIDDTTIAKDLPDADEINNNSNKVMTNKQDKQNLNILEQIIHSNSPQTFTENDDVTADEPVDRPEKVLPDGNAASNSSVLKDDETEDYSSDSDSSSEAVQEISEVNETDSPRQLEEISESSVTRNSVKHVSFQESPVVFESSDTEIHSESSDANEIEEDLPEEDDEF